MPEDVQAEHREISTNPENDKQDSSHPEDSTIENDENYQKAKNAGIHEKLVRLVKELGRNWATDDEKRKKLEVIRDELRSQSENTSSNEPTIELYLEWYKQL